MFKQPYGHRAKTLPFYQAATLVKLCPKAARVVRYKAVACLAYVGETRLSGVVVVGFSRPRRAGFVVNRIGLLMG